VSETTRGEEMTTEELARHILNEVKQRLEEDQPDENIYDYVLECLHRMDIPMRRR